MTSLHGINQCEDFLQFQNALKNLRLLDDKIVYSLNNCIPTASFKDQVNPTQKCSELHEQIESTYSIREEALNKCIDHLHNRINAHKSDGLNSEIRPIQMALRLFTNELSIEKVIRGRTESIFYEKCRDHLPVQQS